MQTDINIYNFNLKNFQYGVHLYHETATDAMEYDINSAISFARIGQWLPSMNTSIQETKT
jgi:hypothetical protein